ncbi:MAG: hypothetical protein AMXMBFR34_28850 [Myxococcaceae bacterium]
MNARRGTEGLHLSVSQMKTWVQCPRKYEFRYVQGVEAEFAPMALVFGTSFHAAMAHHFGWLQRGNPAHADEVKQRFIDSMVTAKAGEVPLQDDEDGMSFDDALAKGRQMIDVTLAHPVAQASVVGVEQKFLVDLFDVESGEVIDEKLMGVFDLVVQEPEGHRTVVELKTSSKKYTVNQLVYDTQLSAYAFAAEQLGLGDVGLRFVVTTKTKVPAVQVEDVRRDDDDLADFLRTAVGVLKAIDAGVSFPIRGWACKSCPYRDRCQADR